MTAGPLAHRHRCRACGVTPGRTIRGEVDERRLLVVHDMAQQHESRDGRRTNPGGCNIDLSMRSTLQEELGDDTTDLVTYQRCMSELAVVNRISFTHRPTLNWL